MNEPNKEVMAVVLKMIRENPDAQLTYKTLIARGKSEEYATGEIGRALLGCIFESHKGMPNRLPDIFHGLREGKSCKELFPDAFYDSTTGP